MNGRVYDPNLGRFLSVDPVFQFPENTQSLNPYSYVRNSPLSLTDPTGFTDCDTDPSQCNKKSGGKTSGEGGSKKDKKDDDHTPNKTRDPRSAHFARANAKFAESGKTDKGTTWHRNLANGTDTRAAANRYDGLVGKIGDTINNLAARLAQFDSANGNAAVGALAGNTISITESEVSPEVRQQRWEIVKQLMTKYGLTNGQQVNFVNSYATAEIAGDGPNMNTLRTHATLEEAQTAVGGTRQMLSGVTTIGSSTSTLYAGAVHGGTISVSPFGHEELARGQYDADGLQMGLFVAVHETFHGKLFRIRGDIQADSRAAGLILDRGLSLGSKKQ